MMKNHLRRWLKAAACISLVIATLSLTAPPVCARMNFHEEIKRLTGQSGSVYVTDCGGDPILKLNTDKKLVPASIFKIVTADAAYHYLKSDFRFKTEFYLDTGDLYIKGYGDPLLISEELDLISDHFKEKGIKSIKNIYLDNSYFDAGIKIDGVERSLNPYDATNGALCVNFNTIFVNLMKDGTMTTAEEQTPMTEYGKRLVRGRLKSGKLKRGKKIKERITLSHEKGETLLYAGHLIKEFLNKKGIKVTGAIKKKTVPPNVIEKIFYTHSSTKDLNDIVVSMMKYSNNFTANQVFLAIGAAVYGEPATVKKGADAVKSYLTKRYGIADVDIAEGSGISRKNQITASDLIKVLCAYKVGHIDTLTENGGALYKTGTLSNVKSAAGFVKARGGKDIGFVIMLNSERDVNKRGRILKLIKGMVNGEDR